MSSLLHAPFEEQAARTPEATALVEGGLRWTYAELNRRAEALARHLAALGVRPEDRVGICHDRSAGMLAALLGVLKAGGAYVPLDPAYPRERLAYMLEDSGAVALVTQEKLRGILPETTAEIVLADSEDGPSARPPLASAAGPDNLAYVIYTSGSTGRPKGVAVEHRSVAAFLAWAQTVFSPADLAGVFASTSISFDISVVELFLPLASGGTVILGENALALPGLPAVSEVTLINTVPSAMSELIRLGALPPSARTVNLGGEALRRTLAERVYATGTVERLYNLYGPTEDTVYSTFLRVPRELAEPVEPTIGVAIDGTWTRLADPWFEAVPPGEVGELLLGGAGLARGYLGRPNLTAERFVPDPSSPEPGGRLYRTGDLARLRPDGELDYLGRIDHQVKIRGFRIELGEIESALQARPGVREAVVVAREDTPGDKRLVAYLVASGEESPAGRRAALREALRERLPEHMVPSAFVFLEELPLTPNGKVDRKALPAPDLGSESREAVPPRNPTEALLAATWERVLGWTGTVGAHDDFFDLGGHSLLAGRVVSQVRDALGIEITVRDLFEAPTPAGLAERLEVLGCQGEGGSAARLAPPIRPVARGGALPLSHSQERLWLIERLSPGTAAYNVPTAIELRGALDVAAWTATLSEIVRRHEILRTVYRPELDGAVQVVLPAAPVPVPLIDLAGLPEEVAGREGLRLAEEDARRPFDLERGPVLRAALLRLAGERWLALIHIHHIATDGWSADVLAAEIQALYCELAAGRPSPLPELAVQYADYAVWQRTWLEGDSAAVIAGQLDYWKKRLAGDTPLELPADRPRPAVFRYRGATLPFSLPAGRIRPLRALARRSGGTLFMALAAGFQTLLARLSGQEMVSVGTPVAGRTRSEIEPLIGFFLNTVVLRTGLQGNPSFAEAVGRVRETALGAHAHADVPFDRVVAELRPERGAGSSPLFQVLFVLDTTPFEALGLPGLKTAEVRPERSAAVFDLTMALAERDEGVVGWLEYSSDLFDRATAERLAGFYATLLGGAALAPETRLSDLPLLSPAERRQLVEDWSGAALPLPPRPETHHEWIERQVDRAPDAVALVFGDGALTYREMDERANRLAHRLIALGAGPEVRIGLYVDRSVEMAIAFLAVLKAGAAFVALDPFYPRERIAMIVEDSRLHLLLVQSALRGDAPLVGVEGVPVLEIEALEAEAAARVPRQNHRPDTGVTADNLLYVVFTSGSTGRPKGIAMTHAGMLNALAWQLVSSRELPSTAATLQFSSLNFDISFQELISTWWTGGKIVLIPGEQRLDPEAVLDLVLQYPIERLYLPPVFLQQLAQTVVDRGVAELPVLEVYAAGEQLQVTPAIRAFFATMPPQAALHNQFGPSETHLTTQLTLPVSELERWPALPAIGTVLPGVHVYLLDRAAQLVPVGVTGEVYIGGYGHARGYIGRPDLTADRFLPDPFSGLPGARLYKTGDLARYRTNGVLDFLGRSDSQVKIRGYRIEPLEVETVLAANPEVEECAVVPRRSAAGELQLAAWVVPVDPEAAHDPEALKRRLREDLATKLPEVMVPARFVMAESLPKTPTGKLDRRSLAKVDLPEEEDAGSAEDAAPRTPTEELLTGLWARVLRQERIRVHDNFFELGGHSLTAAQIAARVRDTFGVDLPARAVFENPTPAALASRIEAARGVLTVEMPPVVPVERDRPLPVSFSQERLWFLEQVQPGGVNDVPLALRIEGPLDVAAWLASLAEVRRRHEALRTTFEVTLEGLVQRVTPAGEPWIQPVIDLSGLAAAQAESERSRIASAEARWLFDLAAGPLVRALLLRVGAEDHSSLLTFHHTVFDGWSVEVLLSELERLYPAFREGRPSPLPELALQYPDFAVWQRDWMEGPGRPLIEAEIEYWRRQLAGAEEDTAVELPTDRPRPAQQSFEGGDVEVEIPAEAGLALRALGREIGATMFMALIASLESLLVRLSGRGKAGVGTAIAGRNRIETEGLIGCFINSLVLRTDLSGDPAFTDALRRVREVTLEAYAHQEVPFARLIQELQPERSTSATPFFQVVLIHVNTPPERLSLPGLRVIDQRAEHGVARLDLAFWLWEREDGGVTGWVEYSDDLLDRATVERLVGTFRNFLVAGAAAPGSRLSELPLLSAAERHQILEVWSGPPALAAADSAGLTIHAVIAAQALRDPDSVAITCRGESITHAELDRRSNRLARHLQTHGVGPEVRVGIYLERSLDLIVALLGVLKAGGAYVPLDPAHPRERLAGIVADSRAAFLLTEAALRGSVPAGDAPVRILDLDEDREAIAAWPEAPLGPAADPDGLAYLLYTSGSTGRPKGVAIAHRTVVGFLRAIREVTGFGAQDVTLALATMSFDISVLEVFLPLTTGGRTELVGRQEATDAVLLAERIAVAGVTLLQATPATWRLLVQSGWAASRPIQGLCGGEPLPRDLADLMLDRLGPEGRLWNVYGPTETTVWSSAGEVRRGEPIAVGPSVPGVRHYLLDRWLQPVPAGVPAEVFVGGAGVGRGYWDRPALTAEVYLPDPFAGTAGSRFYRTGDLGRWLPDGSIDLLGRADFQVKVRGFRIELGEIEGVLGEHPLVRERTVIARKEGNDTRLVAFLVPREGPLALAELRDFLRRRLPDYMVPAAFVQLDRLPLNVNGKVDRKALLALEAEAGAETGSPHGHEAPRTFAEELLVRSWAEVLGREQVGIRDDFFELGGHSLLAAQIVARIQAAFGVRLPMRAIFEAPTPAGLAEAVERALRARSGAAGALPSIVPVRRDGGALPLSFAQEQLWFLSQIQPGAVYNLPYALRLEGRLDLAAWQGALAEIRRRHEALRTTFPARPEGGALQRVAPAAEPWIQPVIDLSELLEGAREGETARLAETEAGRPFDLAAGPLLRAMLVRLSPDEHRALLTVHHIVADGWSTGLLLGELERLYGTLAAGSPVTAAGLPALPVQYADYAVWQREWMRDEALAAPLAYWRRQLAGAPDLELPADRPRPAVHTFRGGIVTFTVPAAQTTRLADLARGSGGTLFMVLAAALQAILHRLSGSLDFTVGTAIANRGRTEVENLIGFFANVLVLRADLAGDPTFVELLGRVRETSLAAYSHQDVPFEKLVEELRPERRLDQNPLFQVAFTFQHIGMPSFAGTGLRVTDDSPHSGTSKFDLSLFVGEDENGLHGLWEYSSDLFERATIERFAGHGLRLLEEVASDPGQRVSTLEILSETERRQLFSEWNLQVSVPLPWPSLHAGFAAQAARTPAAVAVSSEGDSLTYRELDEKADRLAARLRAEGVGPDVLVGLCAERSLDLIVGLLGILKAGGAYVPLDPSYPQERLAFIAEDTAAPVIVVQEHLKDRLPATGARLVGIGETGEGAPAPKPLESGPENAAYVIYTSGSTGRPKGVVVTHANALRLFAATEPWFNFGSGDTWTLFHSYAFDFSVWEIWGALLYGGRLAVVPYFVSRSPEAFADLLRRERVTVLNQTPSAFDALARAILPSGEALPDLRNVIFGGEAISLRALEPWLDRFGEAPRLVNMYGITETTVHVSYRLLTTTDPRSGETPFGSPIGVPIPDLAVHVLDRAGQPVPLGVSGEMQVGGAGLARGYLNRPDLTAERFVPDPFSGRPGARLYRSGDLARRLPSGHLEFLGRADAQVKIRGFRIEPGEIEAALARLPEVAACAVLPRKESQGEAVLAAYVAPRQGATLPPARRLREALLASLPDYMVPGLFVEIEALPVTPSGKVDRRALAQLTLTSGSGTAEGYTAPRTPTEEALAGFWLEVLGAELTGGRIGVHDDFFARGGHSLLATRLINRIRATFGIDLPLRTLFEASTPARLAAKVDAALLAAAGSLSARSAPPIVPVGRGRDLPLSFAQERLWFLDQLQPGSHYNVPLALRLTGPLDRAAWREALQEIRRRHEALRTRFVGRSGGVVQIVDPADSWPLTVVDLAALPGAWRESEARRLVQAESERCFDLATGPLARASLYRLDERDHVSLLTFHHIVSDGWSMGVLMSELGALYSAFASGRPSPLPELPVQYADFAAWQRRWLSGETLDAQLDYWRQRLAGEPFLTLPADRPAPPAQTFRGTSFVQRIPAGLAADLADLGRRSGATLFMVLLAAFDTLIHRYTGSVDLVVGSPIAGRNRPEIEGLIGFFVNTLVLRSDLSGDPTFTELLGQVRETALGAYAHQDLPFEKLVEELRPERRLDQNPIFQVVLSFERLAPVPAWQGVQVSPFELTSWSAKFDLDLAVVEEENGLACWWEYKTDLYDEATIARTAGHWTRLLAALATRPGQRISELSLLTPAESDQLRHEWNPQVSVALPWPSLHAGFAARAARTPEAVAVAGEEGSLTYGELNERADRLAARLRAEGVGPDVLVGLCAERSLDLIVGLLGILKAGGAYVPLDPAYPQERLAFIAEDTAAPVIVVQEHLKDRLPATGARLVGIGEMGEGALSFEVGQEAGPENAAYVIYTSGSTGRPKGVVVTHANALRLFAATEPWFAFGPGDTWALFHSYAFDFSVWEIWGALLYGGRLVVIPYFVSRSPEAFADLLRRERVTVLNQTPSAFDALARAVLPSGEPLSDLRTVIFGGEAISLRALEPWLDRFGEAPRLVNMYGITETTVHVTCRPLASADPRSGETPFGGPIGMPIPDLAVHVVDRTGQLVPVGVPGEMRVGGAGLARGYLNRPDLTAERFVPDPFSGKAGARLYRSGDLARRLSSGHLEFLGRADAQVKIRGFRIEPGEIEAALARLPEIAACAVLPRKEPQGDTVLAAYLVPQPGVALPAARVLREALLASLPDYMVPALFVEIPALPLTPSGKVDRGALARLDLAAAAPGAIDALSATPRTPVEEVLTGLFLEALGSERTGGQVGIHDDFFESGGHSLLATQVVNRIRTAFGIDLPLRALFEAATPAGLAVRVEAALLETAGSPTARSAPPIVPVGRERDLPLSFAQERLWFLDQMQPGGLYNIPLALRLGGRLDHVAWQRSLDEIRRRHETLRTRFRASGGAPVQVIDPPSPGPLPLIDLTTLAEVVREREARRLAQEEAGRPFDLAAGPVARASLIRLGVEDHLALLTFHHIAADGWSLSVLLAELEGLYTGAVLPEMPVQYADFAVWQRQWLSGPALEAQLDYWRRQLAGDPFLALPSDRPVPAVQTFRGAAWSQTLPAELAAGLHDLGRRSGSTLFMLLLAAYSALLHRHSGNVEIAVGSPIAGRNRPEIEGLIGFFVNTLVLRSNLADDPAFDRLLDRTRETALGAYTHQDLPFEKLVEELRPERRLDQNPLFQVVLSLERPTVTVDWAGFRLRPFELASRSAKFDLNLAIVEEEGTLACAWEYKTDLFDETTIARLAGHWEMLLADAVAHPGLPVSRLALLTAAERHQIAAEWNDTTSAFPREATIPERFERQVRLRPEAVALVAGDDALTYRELDERADRLASYLRRLGGGPESRVALALPRSFELITAILGILKAGGAYVPLDPDYPAERLAFMLSDSRAQAVVTRRNLAGRFPVGGVPVIEVDAGDGVQVSGEGFRPAADNLAYVMYTSGSTGTPKGVAVTHRNVIRLVEETGYAEMGPEQTFLQLAPVSFDASTLEIWAPLLHGGRLVLAPEGRISLAELGSLIPGGGVTSMWLTAGLFHQMVDEEIEGLVGLRQLLAGGDVVSPPHARKVLERFPGLTLINGYGPTEGTTFSACHPMRNPAEVSSPVPIGQPIANARLHVLDARLEPVPAGVPGELYIGGDGLARGYLDRPALTAERFVPAPQTEPGERLYRTGDLVRWLPSGRLEFLGRVDLQVKVSGYRVELGELEALLARHPAVGQSAVVVHDDPRAGRRLVAYVAPPPGAARPSYPELRSWLRERLPEPMVPALFVLLDRLPLNPNGKVDRRALPAPGESGIETAETATAAPRTPMEELLVTLWAEALGIDQPSRIGLHDDFFELGGHSLLATRLVARIRQVFRAGLSLRALFEAPTVASLAAILSRQLAEETGPPPPDIVALPREGDEPSFPASLAQRRLWILHQVAPAGFFLNVTHALRFRGDLDPEVLRRVLEEITHRHETLRTTFANRDGQPMQRISPPAPLALPWIDLAALPADRRDPEASRIAQDEAARPFDLVRGPLARFALLRLAVGEHVLILTPHHLVFDGRSMEILFHELAVLYEAHLAGRTAPLPALPVQYADFAFWQREAMAGPALESQLRYWKGQLAGVPPLELPLDRPRPATGSFRGDWHSSDLAPGLLERLAGICRRQGVTQFMALMAAVELFLARATNQSDFPIGTPIANRSRPEVEELIGFFVNTLVLRADLSGAPSFLTLLERVRESALGAYTHQELPFESLVEELQPERQLTANPIFGVLFNMLDAPQPVDFTGVRVEAFEFELDLAHFDLMVTAMRGSREDAGAMTLVLNHSRDLFDRTTARRMLDLLVRLLEGGVADPERPVWDLPVFDAAAWHQVVREWNDTAGPLLVPVTTERLIERCGREIPDALAVSAPGTLLTYAELNDRANRLAHRLQRLGIGPEVTVALGFERSAELIVSALAVWKAGGAFLPLDLSAPADRLALVVEDAAAPLVITTQATAERFASCLARVLSFEVEAAGLDQESPTEPRRSTVPENRAYVIYTSGSTGRPKGVEVQHSSLFNLILWQHRRFAITHASRVNLAAIPAFDASIYEIWPYLTAGASVHVPPAEITPSAREMLRWIAREKITHGYLTTPQADRALAGERPEELTDLRWILAGGDRLHQRPFRTDAFDLINIYGPTEATVVTTYRQVTRTEDAPPRLPTIGGPLMNVAVHLLDHQLRPVPIGSLGELYIAGSGLARGYLGRPALTAERYVPHPFADEPGARLYKTGDLVRYLPNGRLDFVGRTDHQVKIRGFRIELGEIEAVLATHPGVAEAVVIVRNEATGPRLVGYLVPRDRAGFPEVSAVREALRAKLPEYMVPSAFVLLDALPLTSRDKVDRNALPAPPGPGSPEGGDGAASRASLSSGTEERIAGVWRDVLRIEAVGGEDNFFDLGGHSLAMVAIHERLQSELGRDFPLVEMFENPTIRSLALALDRFQAGSPAPEPAAERQDVQQRAEKQRNAQAWKDRARQARRTPR